MYEKSPNGTFFLVSKLYFKNAVKNHIYKNEKLLVYEIYLIRTLKNYWMAMKLDKKWKEAKHMHYFSMN